MVRRGILTLIFFLFTGSAYAQSLQVSAQVDRQEVSVGEQLVYQVSISGENIQQVPNPKLPDLSGKFNVVSTSESTSMSWINGKISGSVAKIYVLVPLKTGVITLEPASVSFKGQTYQSNAIQIKVGKGNGRAQVVAVPGQNANIFLQSSLNKKEVYVGEEVVYSLILFTRLQLYGAPSWDVPGFQGFWSEGLQKHEKPYRQEMQGQPIFAIDILKKSLFPLNPGSITIGAAKMGFRTHPFEGQHEIQSQALTLKVLPLPQVGKPAYFMGAVGEFSLRAAPLSQTSVVQNTPLTVKITLTGRGNLKNIQDLTWPEKSEFRIYKSKTQDQINQTDGVSGTRTFEYVMIPKVSGKVTVPAFSLSYFSPQTRSYKTISIPENTLTCLPSSPSQAMVSTTEKLGSSQLKQDISYLKSPIRVQAHPGWGLWGMGAIILTASLLNIVRGVRDTLVQINPKAFRKKHARQLVLTQLQALQSDQQGGISELELIFLAFLADRLGQSVKGLTREELAAVLTFKEISPHIIDLTLALLDDTAQAIYAPVGASVADKPQLIARAKALIQDITV